MTDLEPSRGEFTTGYGIEVSFIRRFIGDRREDMIESVKVNGRPLVVIDPEDREAVERLAALLHNLDAHLSDDPHRESAWVALAYDALCDFANPKPPKPEEPTDQKARVTDRRENVWRLLADGDWICVDGPDAGEYLDWQGLTERGPLEIEIPDA